MNDFYRVRFFVIMVVMYSLYNFFAGRTFPVVEFFLEDSLDMTKQVQYTT